LFVTIVPSVSIIGLKNMLSMDIIKAETSFSHFRKAQKLYHHTEGKITKIKQLIVTIIVRFYR